MPRTKTTRDGNVYFAMVIPVVQRDIIDGLRGRIPAKRSAIAREALRLGLAVLEDDPAKFVRA